MSHQTGIRANDRLVDFFGDCRDGRIRLFRVSIVDEELTLDGHMGPGSDWEKDLDQLLPPLLEESTPCYVLFRLDKRDAQGYLWLLVTWIPEISSVRQKMLYASTKATLKSQFGSGQIADELHWSEKEEATLQGYRRTLADRKAPAPLTQAEEELALVKTTESRADISVDSKTQTLGGVAFPLSEDAARALIELKHHKNHYVRLAIDLKEEIINLESTEETTVHQLASRIPADRGRYHLFRFGHTNEGDYLESIVFIYSMPGYACPIRERMLYSSCKGPVVDLIEGRIGLAIDKKIEVDSGSEVSEEALLDELHPKKNLHRPKFEKPKGPPGRGARRITKKTGGQDDSGAP